MRYSYAMLSYPIYSVDLVNAYTSKVVPKIRLVTSRFKTSTPRELDWM